MTNKFLNNVFMIELTHIMGGIIKNNQTSYENSQMLQNKREHSNGLSIRKSCIKEPVYDLYNPEEPKKHNSPMF